MPSSEIVGQLYKALDGFSAEQIELLASALPLVSENLSDALNRSLANIEFETLVGQINFADRFIGLDATELPSFEEPLNQVETFPVPEVWIALGWTAGEREAHLMKAGKKFVNPFTALRWFVANRGAKPGKYFVFFSTVTYEHFGFLRLNCGESDGSSLRIDELTSREGYTELISPGDCLLVLPTRG